MIRAAIIGYGQMGKLLEEHASQYNIEIVSIIDPLLNNTISSQSLNQAEVCFEFTNPDSVVGNIRKLAQLKKNIIIGTTGWHQHLDKMEKLFCTFHNELSNKLHHLYFLFETFL